jgi:tetratricopeptide (TPR) repeat protein
MQDDALARGWKLQQAGNLDEAEFIYREILRLDPSEPRAWYVLGMLHQTRKQPVEAERCFRQALRYRPDEAEGYYQLGSALLQQGKQDEAAANYVRCLELRPNYAEALANLGYIRGEQNKYEEAEALCRRALELNPQYAEVHHNLGNILKDQSKFEEAVPVFQQALRLKPDYLKAHLNLGIALVLQNKPEEAEACMRRALEIEPDNFEVINSLGATLSAQGRLREAIACYQQALRLYPDFAEAHWNLALASLLLGDFELGWSEFEWRWKCPRTKPWFAFEQPQWDGSSLAGKIIVLQEEQGLGDILHFVRYAALAKKQDATVILHCPRKMTRILASCRGVDRVVGRGEPLPLHHYYAPLLSLPRLFKTNLETIPGEVPYLFADPGLVAYWRQELAAIRGFRIGIVWQGNPSHPWDRPRSIPLAAFEPLARVPGVRLISLQKGPGTEQIAALADRIPMVSFGSQVDEASGAFMDSAAIMKNLDLVVTADTSAAHLAGALGVPVWVAIFTTPDWRWLMDREDSPWYPTMRLFRQTRLGDWAELFERMAKALEQLVASRPRPNAVTIEVSPGELIDKITILEIKSQRIKDAAKLQNVRKELASLAAARDQVLQKSESLSRLTAQLQEVNEALWEIEDRIRQCERARDFGPAFTELARSVYQQNDRRSAIKRQINELLGSGLIEEKSYTTDGTLR